MSPASRPRDFSGVLPPERGVRGFAQIPKRERAPPAGKSRGSLVSGVLIWRARPANPCAVFREDSVLQIWVRPRKPWRTRAI
jgi:hypothetical protein